MTLRQRIAAAYDRSAWARLAMILSTMAVTWAGWWLGIMLLPVGLQPPLCIVWALAVAIVFAKLAVGPRRELP